MTNISMINLWTDDVIVPTLSVCGGHDVAYRKGSRESISLLYN